MKEYMLIISAIAPYIKNIQKNELLAKGALMYDVLAAYFILYPSSFTVKQASIAVNTENDITSEDLVGNTVAIKHDGLDWPGTV